MKLFVIAAILLGFQQWASADDVESRRAQIIQIINEELSEVDRLSRQTGGKNPDFLLRMAELNLEKARLIREKENKEFLEIPPKKRRKINVKKYFSQSEGYFQRANSLALKIARKFKRYKRIGEVYYILGYNAKEASKTKTAAKYLRLATQKTRDKKTKVRTQISLAEVYYNEKKYSKAIPLYESALKSVNDKWWTKDSFNLAWCYFRVRNYSKAINLMEQIYSRSKSNKFIDMRIQVERDIGLFYATAGRVNEGISFYKKLGINFSSQLITIALSLKEQGQFTFANNVLAQAAKYEKKPNKLHQIYLEQLALFETFGKYDEHLDISRKLFKSLKEKALYSDQVEKFSYQLAKVSALLQRQAIGKTYKRLKKIRRKKANQAIEYFYMLSIAKPKQAAEYKYLQAETAYAVGLYSSAYNQYKDTYEFTKKNEPKSQFRGKALEGMLIVLGSLKGVDPAKNIYAFNEYLKTYPRGKKSKDIYVRLFNNYKAKNDLRNASLVLDKLVKNYPNDKTQEAMIAELMEVSRKNRDYAAIRNWINEIEAGKYKVSKKYRLKLQELLTTIQIDDVQSQLAKGNKKTALVGYLKILDDPYSTKKSKVNAKYNLAALYFELGDTQNTHKWALNALTEMDSNDVLKFASSFVTMANFLFSSLEFAQSSEVLTKLVEKLCSKKTRRKNLAFRNAAYIYLADGKIQKTEDLVRLGRKCKVLSSYIDDVEYEIMREFYVQRNWNRYEYYVLKLQNSRKVYNLIIDDLLNLITVHSKFSNQDKVKQFNTLLWKLYYRAKKNKDSISMRGLDYFASLKLMSMEETVNQLNLIKFAFPENIFASRQKKKLSLLTKLTGQANDVQAVGSGVGIVNSFKVLSETYESVAKEIYDFVPKGKSKEYVQKFKADFNQVGKQLEQAANQYRTEALRAINNNLILNKNNVFFQKNKFPVEYHGEHSAVLMDRGGK